MFLLFSRLDDRFNCGIKGSEIPYGVHFSVTTFHSEISQAKEHIKIYPHGNIFITSRWFWACPLKNFIPEWSKPLDHSGMM